MSQILLLETKTNFAWQNRSHLPSNLPSHNLCLHTDQIDIDSQTHGSKLKLDFHAFSTATNLLFTLSARKGSRH